MSLSTKPKLISLGKTNITVLGEDNKLWVYGFSKDGHLGPNTNYEAFTKFPFGDEDDENGEKIIDMSSGTHFTLYVTDLGKLFGSGNRFMKELGMDTDNKII